MILQTTLIDHRAAILVLALVTAMVGTMPAIVTAAPMPGGVYIGWVYVNGVPVSDFTVDVSLGPTYYYTSYYAADDPKGSYEMDITIPDGGSTTGDVVCTVPGVGVKTLRDVDLMKCNASCNWYFTTGTAKPTATVTATTKAASATAYSTKAAASVTQMAASATPTAVTAVPTATRVPAPTTVIAASFSPTTQPGSASGSMPCPASLLLPALAIGAAFMGTISRKRGP
jgi:hypothetical protein